MGDCSALLIAVFDGVDGCAAIFDQGGIEDGGDGQGVAEVKVVAVGVDIEPAPDETRGDALAWRCPGTPVSVPGEEDLSADIQSYQGDGRAGLEDDVGGAGVAVGVELGVGGNVAGGPRWHRP